jgi:hypothetical protein
LPGCVIAREAGLGCRVAHKEVTGFPRHGGKRRPCRDLLFVSPASTCHPASVSFTRATSVILSPTMRSACADARPGAYQLDQQLGRKSVREHQRLGAAVGRGGEQLKGEATVGLGAAATAVRVWHGVGGGGEPASAGYHAARLLDGGSHRRANTRPIQWRLKCEKTFQTTPKEKGPAEAGPSTWGMRKEGFSSAAKQSGARETVRVISKENRTVSFQQQKM